MFESPALRFAELLIEQTGRNYLVDANNPTGFAQVLELEETVLDLIAGGPAVIRDLSYTLGLDVIGQWDTTSGPLFLLYDGHGSTRALLDAAGQIMTNPAESNQKQVFAYDAYGNLLYPFDPNVSTPKVPLTTLLYSGEQTDPTGQQYLRGRYYNPATGRFNRLDPSAGNNVDPQSLHKYLYTHGDPVNGIDPSGLFTLVSFSVNFSISSDLRSINQSVQSGALSNTGRTIAHSAQRSLANALNALRQSPHLIRQYSRQVAKHIVGRHTPPLSTANVGKNLFKTSNPRKILKLIDKTLKTGEVAGNTGGRAWLIFTRIFNSPVGTNAAGQAVNAIKVVVSETGKLITAFPI